MQHLRKNRKWTLIYKTFLLGSSLLEETNQYANLNCVRVTSLSKDFQEGRIRHKEEPWEKESFFLEVPVEVWSISAEHKIFPFEGISRKRQGGTLKLKYSCKNDLAW